MGACIFAHIWRTVYPLVSRTTDVRRKFMSLLHLEHKVRVLTDVKNHMSIMHKPTFLTRDKLQAFKISLFTLKHETWDKLHAFVINTKELLCGFVLF